MPAGIALSDFYYILPEIVLTVGALVLLLADLIVPRDKQSVLAWVALAALAATGAALVPVADAHLQISHGLIAVDRFALFFKVIFLGAAARWRGSRSSRSARRWPRFCPSAAPMWKSRTA